KKKVTVPDGSSPIEPLRSSYRVTLRRLRAGVYFPGSGRVNGEAGPQADPEAASLLGPSHSLPRYGQLQAEASSSFSTGVCRPSRLTLPAASRVTRARTTKALAKRCGDHVRG